MEILTTLDIEETTQQSGPEYRPRSISETGVRAAVLEDLALKILYLSGPFSVRDLARLMGVGYGVTDQIFSLLRAKVLCEVTGMVSNIPSIAITSLGRTRAMGLLAQGQYAGIAPVSLKSYVEQVKKQAVHKVQVKREDVEQAFADLVLDDTTISQFGAALNSGEAIFIYGAAGVGKTAVAEALSSVLAKDSVWIPYAVEVDGQIIVVFDPTIHKPVGSTGDADNDMRWVRCQRPTVLVGGELTIEMLDLQFNPVTHYYVGPVQMKANNGTLIIDDFGRQRLSPEELLNRWVVPLDRGIEFLTLAGGRKVEIPFQLFVVFASNKDPGKLLDPAFLRRIQTKIKLGAITPEQFYEIFRRFAKKRGIEVDEEALRELVVTIRDELKEELRGCQSRDLINQVTWAARYQGTQPRLDRESLRKAVDSYFLARS